MKPFRSPLFWFVFVLFGATAVFFGRTHYARTFPILDQPLTMNREAATQAAERLAQAQGWRPTTARTTTRLWQDSDLTTFIELEAGGKDNLSELLHENRIVPYRWQIRLFREKDAAETLVEFRPDGRFLGFSEKLPEAQTGPELTKTAARTLAETQAAALGTDLSAYQLVESKNNRTSSGRLDHTFTFERQEPRLHAGRDQIVLTVRGDRFCGLEPRVKIPEDFARRYAAMRTSNTNLQLAASVSTILILVLGCTLGGLWFLFRREAINWRGALNPTLVLAVGGALSALNLLPLFWFGYDTALTTGEFQTRNLVLIVVQSLAGLLSIAVLASAEGLGRLAFPRYPQIWRVFSPRAAGTRPIVGTVTASYLLAAAFFAYAVWMARFGAEHLGWWFPSSARFDFGQMGAVVPWFPPFFISLQAGLTEECLFRALPLASAVLLGRRFGRPALWLGITIVLQALIFGGMHSAYPTTPGWARMVELFLPSLGFALLYLRFGLLPGILTHFLYDLVFLGLPLFVDRSPGSRLHAVILGGLGLSPLAWVWFCRFRAGAWQELPDDLRNQGWIPRVKPAATTPPPLPTPSPVVNVASPAALRLLFAAGLVALSAWGLSMNRAKPDMPGIPQRKAEAIAQARAALAVDGVTLGADWEIQPLAHTEADNERTFVWQTAGEATFQKLSGNYITVPGWRVRFVRSTLPLPDRAEEYRVYLDSQGQVQRYEHILPESRPGAQLAQPAALAIAEQQLQRIYKLNPSSLTLVSANETKQPSRSDWLFIWKDPAAGLTQGEARTWIYLVGDQLSGYQRHIFIPEEWTRAQASGDNARSLTTGLLTLATVIVLMLAIGSRFAAWKQNAFSWKTALIVAGIIFVVFELRFAITIPTQLAWMSTNEPFHVQLLRTGIGSVVGGIIIAGGLGLLAGLGSGLAATPSRRTTELLAGLGAGFLLLWGERTVQLYPPHWHPWHAGIDGANTGIPLLGSLWLISSLVGTSLSWLRVQNALHARVRSSAVRTLVVATLGFCYGASFSHGLWIQIFLSGAFFAGGFALLEKLIARTHPSVLVAVVTAQMMGKAAADIFIPGQPDALRDSLVALVLITVVGGVLFHLMRRPTPPTVLSLPN